MIKRQGSSHRMYFVGLYAAEHVAATEFVIGATFVGLGASTMDILVGLLIGNVSLSKLDQWAIFTGAASVKLRH
jgi:cytosine/uracil/thiamine/allantoin permease